MSAYKSSDQAKETRYWYFRFTDSLMFSWDFRKMERLPAGYEYEVILLKMYSMSVRFNGTIEIPSDADGNIDIETFADFINHKSAISVREAMKYFLKEHLIEIYCPDGERDVYQVDIPGVRYLIGSSTKDADRKRIERQNKKQASLAGLNSPDDNKAAEQEPAVEAITVIKKNCSQYGTFKNVRLTDSEYEELNQRYENADVVIERLSIYKKKSGTEYADDYAAALSFAIKDGKPRENEADRKAAIYEKYKREAQLGFPPPQDAYKVLTELQVEELERIAEENMQ